jgi:hypothetical protein
MFERDRTYIALGIQVENRIFVEILGLGNVAIAKLDIQSVGIREVLNLHGLNPRSKNALWTVRGPAKG